MTYCGAGPISISTRLKHYLDLLKQYMRRKMGYDSDAINAFGGILKLLGSDLYPGGFLEGLPVEDLPMTLMWEPLGPRRRPAFPAWSWAGWEGELARCHGQDGESSDGSGKDTDAWRRPYIQIWKSMKGALEQIYLSEPSENRPPFYGVVATQEVTIPREKLPVDAFWDLSKQVTEDPAYPKGLILEGEQKHYLFIECITIRLQLYHENKAEQASIGEVVIGGQALGGLECRILWHTKRKDWKDEVRR